MRECDKQMLADHYLDFYQMAYALLRNETDVEDAVQDALVETMSQPFVKNPYNYCSKVLKNKCLKMLKKNTYILTEHLPDLPDTPNNLDEQRMQTLWNYKEQLPKRIREILDLYYIKGYTRQQISELTQTSMPTLKKLFHKGHTKLKKRMLDHDRQTSYLSSTNDN